MFISSSSFGFTLLLLDAAISSGTETSSLVENISSQLEEEFLHHNIIMFSATISVLYLFTQVWSSQLLV